MGRKELIMSEYQDWQYVESLKGKINVVKEAEYSVMEPRERDLDRLYFCRSYLSQQNPIIIHPMPSRVCQCLSYYNPD